MCVCVLCSSSSSSIDRCLLESLSLYMIWFKERESTRVVSVVKVRKMNDSQRKSSKLVLRMFNSNPCDNGRIKLMWAFESEKELLHLSI